MALAVRVRRATALQQSALNDNEDEKEGDGDRYLPDVEAAANIDLGTDEWDRTEEAFLELGMEVVDGLQHDEGCKLILLINDMSLAADGGTALDPLEEARMTIMTHLWPNMVRKPLGTRTAVDLNLDSGLEDVPDEGGGALRARTRDGSDGGEGSEDSNYDSEEDGETSQADFAIKFASPRRSRDARHPETGMTGTDTPLSLASESWSRTSGDIDADTGPTAGPSRAPAEFPSLVMLNQQLAETSRMFAQLKVERDLAEQRRMERLDRLERELQLDSDDEDLAGDDHGGGIGGVGRQGEDDSDEGEEIRFGQGPAREEWARLDDWLDADLEGDRPEAGAGELEGEEGYEMLDEDDIPVAGGSGDGNDRDFEVQRNISLQGNSQDPPKTPERSAQGALPDPNHRKGDGFEDDFADFQSGPTPDRTAQGIVSYQRQPKTGRNGQDPDLPMDPTPLLLHLQSIRAELAGLPDEDERRVRAAREVMAILGLKGDEVGVEDDEGMGRTMSIGEV